MNHSWNISLFHYRNHGAAFGQVLMGLQVPKKEHRKLQKFIRAVGFAATIETKNPAYRMFLRG